MKVNHPSKNPTSLEQLILQLQLTLKLSQFQKILSIYTDFLLLFAEYPYLFIFFKNEPNSLQGKNALFKNRFITQDPARDGGNWWAYCSNNPLTRIDLTGLNDKNAYDEMKNNIYMLRINVNLPGKGPTNDTLLSSKIEQNSQGYVALDGGHAFVSLIHINLETMDIENNSYGLYPAEKTGIIKGENVKGQIKDDSDSYYDNSFTFFITKEGYQKAKDYADVKKENPPDYNLYTNNCVDFSISISKKAGIDIPNLPIGSSPNSLNDILQINGLFGGNK